MKRKTFWLWTAIVLLLAMNGLLLLQSFQAWHKNRTLRDIIDRWTIEDHRNRGFESFFEFNLTNSGLTLADATVCDSARRELRLSELFREGEERLLVSRFSEHACQSCVEYANRKIARFTDTLQNFPLVYLGMYKDVKSLNLVRPNLGVGQRAYCSPLLQGFPLDLRNMPCYFVLDRRLQITDVFVPDQMTPDLTNRYLQAVKEKIHTIHESE